MKTDAVQTNESLPAAKPVKPPNYMVFRCSLDRGAKAARKAGTLDRFEALRAEALAAYKAKDYAKAVALHDEAHRAAAAEAAATGSPRPPKAAKAKKAAAPKPAAKGAAKQPAKVGKPAQAGEGKLSAMGAAHKVLTASKNPMNVKAIVAEMSTQGLWSSPGGRTPHSTLAAALMRDIASKGRESRFKKVGRGMFTASGRGA